MQYCNAVEPSTGVLIDSHISSIFFKLSSFINCLSAISHSFTCPDTSSVRHFSQIYDQVKFRQILFTKFCSKTFSQHFPPAKSRDYVDVRHVYGPFPASFS